jgi:hypothetical protein
MRLTSWILVFFPFFTDSFSQLPGIERLFATHLNMYRTAPRQYCDTYHLSLPEPLLSTMDNGAPPLVFMDALYPCARDYAKELVAYPECFEGSCPPSFCSVYDDHNCSLAQRVARFCPQCSRYEEIVVRVGHGLSDYQETVLLAFARTLLDPRVNTATLSLQGEFLVLDTAFVPDRRLPVFFGGAHFRKDEWRTNFWTTSLSLFQITIVLYDHTVQYMDEFTMQPSDLSTAFTTFSFGTSDYSLQNITTEDSYVYYAFRTSLNQRDVYSEMFALYFPQLTTSP